MVIMVAFFEGMGTLITPLFTDSALTGGLFNVMTPMLPSGNRLETCENLKKS
jgi:hypothetical protein